MMAAEIKRLCEDAWARPGVAHGLGRSCWLFVFDGRPLCGPPGPYLANAGCRAGDQPAPWRPPPRSRGFARVCAGF